MRKSVSLYVSLERKSGWEGPLTMDEVAASTFHDGSLVATLQFSNPNVGSINLAKSTHQLTLNGKPAGVIEITEPLGLPAQQTITTTVALKPAAGTALSSGQVSYQIVSNMTLSIYDESTERFKTSSSGTVTVP